jgi:peptide/nickel transport system permease protein
MSINTGSPSPAGDFAGGPGPGPIGSPVLAQSVGVAGGAELGAVAPSAGGGGFGGGRRWEFLHFALRNPKLMVGLGVELIFVAVAIFGPLLAPYSPTYHGTPGLHPSAQHIFGTTSPFGTDVFSQVLYGVRDSYVVGALGALFAGAVGLVVGFAAGYRGGVLDEILQLFTNVMICIPQLVLLIVISAYLTTRGVLFEGIFIGVTGWPWVARAVRAQTFTLRERDFVDLARLSGRRAVSIVVKDIAPNMASYIFLVFVLLFASSMLVAVNFDFLGLGPTNGLSLGDIMNQSTLWSALELHMWWWFIPPGAALTLMVLALYIANVGLDEVFNPKLRQT